MSGYLVLGAGGHAKVVADILLCQKLPVLGFLDDDSSKWGTVCLNLPVLGSIDSYADYQPDGLILGIGSNSRRQNIVHRLGKQIRDLWYSAIHPSATIARSARIGHGVVIAAGGIINPDVRIGDHAIINTGATVDHDCVIGDYAHVAPGARLAGGVNVGQGALVGIGASVIPGKSIGDWAVIGAGAVVVRDISAHKTAKGVPARWEVDP
jgi:sugar O-acyltransferase (sialic acid O-acetyltransferase NeuD family)